MSRLKRQTSKQESINNDETIGIKRESSVEGNLADEMSSTRVTAIKEEDSASAHSSPSLNATHLKSSRSSSQQSTTRSKPSADSVDIKHQPEDTNGQISPAKTETTKSKMSRSASSKNPPRIAPLLNDLPDATDEATNSFSVMDACTYQNKYLGYTEHSMSCDCQEEWNSSSRENVACGEDSDCINRATKMECYGDCDCGSLCQNQRFSRRLYADVSVIKTEKKGYGLRINTDLKPHSFIFEYIGECIGEAQFRKRMIQYDDEGIKHFYFMSLSKGEFLDATKKGNLGRFCNHSCNPNCYVDKWVVGDKLRMGIFAEKPIKAGEELVFNYNVDRYGANPQPCYCGESNCTGFIGGKTQTERGTKLSAATIEALGIEDADSWDTMVARRPRKKKTEEDDEDYVDSVEAKALDADSVTKVMAALMQCKEKWIAVKLLQRIQSANDEMVCHRIVKLHGYRILNSQLSAWREDENIVLQILDILNHFPRLTRNKIVDAKIDQTLQPLAEHSDGRVASRSTALLDAWSKLELAYRIPRKKRDETSTPTKAEPVQFDRRESAQERKRSRSRSKSPPRGPSNTSAPSGPRSLQRPGNFHSRPPGPSFHRVPPPLPRGWFTAQDKGRTYYYSASGQTTWSRPTQPADQPPPPPKQPSEQDVLKSIIDNIVTAKERGVKNTTPDTPEPSKKELKEERWKSYDEEKQRKLYENTLFPHISHVMNKYKHKIPRDDLKRFAKEIAKKLVASDYKAGRVKDPTKVDERQQKKVKEFCKQYFDKAAHKHKKHEEEKSARKQKKQLGAPSAFNKTPEGSPRMDQDLSPETIRKKDESEAEDIQMSDNEAVSPSETPASPSDHAASLKRKRSEEAEEEALEDEGGPTQSPLKKLNMDTPPPPPPPPAPPIETPPASTPREDDTDIHADTNFRAKSMADVLAQAQREADEEDSPMLTEEDSSRFEEGLRTNGVIDDEDKLENPLVDGQMAVDQIRDELR